MIGSTRISIWPGSPPDAHASDAVFSMHEPQIKASYYNWKLPNCTQVRTQLTKPPTTHFQLLPISMPYSLCLQASIVHMLNICKSAPPSQSARLFARTAIL